jgi:hypothetical protein
MINFMIFGQKVCDRSNLDMEWNPLSYDCDFPALLYQMFFSFCVCEISNLGLDVMSCVWE